MSSLEYNHDSDPTPAKSEPLVLRLVVQMTPNDSDFDHLRRTPNYYGRLRPIPNDSERLWSIPNDSKWLHSTPGDSVRFRTTLARRTYAYHNSGRTYLSESIPKLSETGRSRHGIFANFTDAKDLLSGSVVLNKSWKSVSVGMFSSDVTVK